MTNGLFNQSCRRSGAWQDEKPGQRDRRDGPAWISEHCRPLRRLMYVVRPRWLTSPTRSRRRIRFRDRLRCACDSVGDHQPALLKKITQADEWIEADHVGRICHEIRQRVDVVEVQPAITFALQ